MTKQLLLFLFSFAIGLWMVGEGLAIIVQRKIITPAPKRILFWIGALFMGQEKSRQRFGTPSLTAELRTYAAFALVFGALVLAAALVYLLTAF